MKSWWRANSQRVPALRLVQPGAGYRRARYLVQLRPVAVFHARLARRTEDLATFYPTSLLITGFDILFFWVARMIMMGIEFMGEVPFRQVYIHGLVRDAERQKMSKTRGNTIDPLVVTEKYGTDAVRMALLQGRRAGHRHRAHRRAHGKLARLRQQNLERGAPSVLNMERSGVEPWVPESPGAFRPEAGPTIEVRIEDRWIFSRLNTCAEQANRAIEQCRYHEAAQLLWHFFWHEFCDWYLELKKPCFQENSGLNAGWRNTLAAFETALRLLHPAMPFLTEELWQRLANRPSHAPASIALAEYPQYNPQNHRLRRRARDRSAAGGRNPGAHPAHGDASSIPSCSCKARSTRAAMRWKSPAVTPPPFAACRVSRSNSAPTRRRPEPPAAPPRSSTWSCTSPRRRWKPSAAAWKKKTTNSPKT
jgi:isoleucyl-tRNA synthetase